VLFTNANGPFLVFPLQVRYEKNKNKAKFVKIKQTSESNSVDKYH